MKERQSVSPSFFILPTAFPLPGLWIRMRTRAANRREESKMETTEKFTSADLALMPDDGQRYEVIEGALYVSKQPSSEHQFICGQLFRYFQEWNDQSGLGVASSLPG